MRLREVLDRPELRLTLLCGTDDALDRTIERVYTTDLLDPSRYLAGNELVLTGLMWRRDPIDSESFVANLAKIGVAAIGAGEAALGHVPSDLIDACRRHGVTLLSVPVEVSFQTITEQVSQSIMSERASGLAVLLGRERGLVWQMARGARLADLLPSVAGELGISCWVYSATGRLHAGTGFMADTVKEHVIRVFLEADRLPCTAEVDGRELRLMLVPGRPEQRVAAWCLVCEGQSPARPLSADAADEVLSLVTLERARIDQVRRSERLVAAELVRVMVGPREPADLRAALHACRMPTDGTYLVAAAGVVDVSTGSARVPANTKLVTYLLDELVRPLAARVAVGHVAGEAMAVLTTRPEAVVETVDALRRTANSLTPGLRGQRLAIGVSDIASGMAALTGAAEQARHTKQTASRLAEPAAVVSSADLASHVLLLASVGVEARQSFRSLLLGSLVEYDRTHHADLVRTLDAFLRCSGSWQRCADEMHVHVNTLRYRLQRVEQLTGRDLSRFEDRVDFFLALRLPE